MRIVVVPPLHDPTLEWVGAPGERVLDVSRTFVRRVLEPAELAREAEVMASEPPSPERLRALLQVRAAAQLLATPGSVHRALRAAGAALAGCSGPPSPVRMRLDDLELVRGTTESSTDVLNALASGPAPYQPELESAAEEMRASGAARLVLVRDQQLPAALWLAQASEGIRLEVVGAFAVAHREVLGRLPGFSRAEFVADAPRWRVAGLPGQDGGGPGLWWHDPHPNPLPEGEGAWGGMVSRAELARPDALVASGCRVAVVGFCALGAEVLDSEGHLWPREEYVSAVERLRRAGVCVVAEWWVGAPGVDAALLDSTASELERASPFDWLAGLRIFHWPRLRPGGRFGHVEVAVHAPAPEKDLARNPRFSAPGTIDAEQLPALIERLARERMRHAPLSPGRVAQGYAAPPPPPAERGDLVRRDPDCALVEMPVALDGKPGPVWYAANLRTGSVLALDGRLAPGLRALTSTATAAEALPRVPEAQRARVLQLLVGKGVLEEVKA